MAQPGSPIESFRFLALPIDIRYMIYELLPTETHIQPMTDMDIGFAYEVIRLEPAIKLVSRQVHNEAVIATRCRSLEGRLVVHVCNVLGAPYHCELFETLNQAYIFDQHHLKRLGIDEPVPITTALDPQALLPSTRQLLKTLSWGNKDRIDMDKSERLIYQYLEYATNKLRRDPRVELRILVCSRGFEALTPQINPNPSPITGKRLHINIVVVADSESTRTNIVLQEQQHAPRGYNHSRMASTVELNYMRNLQRMIFYDLGE